MAALVFYESLDDNDVYILLADVASVPMVRKWARESSPRPSSTMGVPSSEQISSPVTFGDHKMVAETRKYAILMGFLILFVIGL